MRCSGRLGIKIRNTIVMRNHINFVSLREQATGCSIEISQKITEINKTQNKNNKRKGIKMLEVTTTRSKCNDLLNLLS
jgi:hypothetical protein